MSWMPVGKHMSKRKGFSERACFHADKYSRCGKHVRCTGSCRLVGHETWWRCWRCLPVRAAHVGVHKRLVGVPWCFPNLRLWAPSKYFRTIRPFAHHIDTRRKPRERIALLQSGTTLILADLSKSWCALVFETLDRDMRRFLIGKDGLTLHLRRHGERAEYRYYPFVALVLERLLPRSNLSSPSTNKLLPCLIPCVLVEVSNLGKCHGVVLISKFTNEHRSSTTGIRRTSDVVFPKTFSFPLNDRLAPHGACSDRTLPAPRVADDGGGWNVWNGCDDDDTQRSPSNSRWRPGLTGVSVGVITPTKKSVTTEVACSVGKFCTYTLLMTVCTTSKMEKTKDERNTGCC